MSEAATCPRCGLKKLADSPSGLCPGCLFRQALETSGSMSAADPDAPLVPVPPTCEELASSFPGLELLRFLGRGGMGMVYQARQKHLGRMVALKILNPQLARDPHFSDRFSREARMMALLTDPHAVAVYEFGSVPASAERDSPLYFLLMEYVDGLSLRQLLETGQLDPIQALAIVPQICKALQAAHDKGIVHRDIKPENILLSKSGEVKIADFGIAKLMGVQPRELTLSATGQVLGTIHYMAPEQVERPLEVDHRADIYAVGVVLYQMLTGELPIGHFPPPSQKAAIDARLDEVVLRALAKEPRNRYQQASALRSHVETIAQSPAESRTSKPTGKNTLRTAVWSRWKRMPRGVKWLAAVFSAFAVTFTVAQVIDATITRRRFPQGEPADSPFWMREAKTDDIIAAGIRRPDRPWAWQELAKRPLSDAQVAAILDGIIEWLKQEPQETPTDPIPWCDNFLKSLAKLGRISGAQQAEFMTAYVGGIRGPDAARTRELNPSLNLKLDWRRSFSDDIFQTATLNELTSVEIDGQPMPLPDKVHRQPNSQSNNSTLKLTPLIPGKHAVKLIVLTAIVSKKDIIGLKHDAPSSDWPPAIRKWTRTKEMELQVFANDDQIISLTTDPSLDPTRGLQIESIVIRKSGSGKQAVIDFKNGAEKVKVAVSCDVKLRIQNRDVTSRSMRLMVLPPKPEQNSNASFNFGALTADIGELPPDITTADLILTPNAEYVELDPRVDQIWGKEIEFKNIPLRRLDLPASEASGQQ